MGSEIMTVGQPFFAAAAFEAASGSLQKFRESRLKAGCSQEWLPHSTRDELH